MVFSSIPLYLDPPNWQQHQNELQGSGGNDQDQHHLLPSPPGMGGGAQRASSMSERAKLAKIPAPEAPLKCPRCDSSNTKFCYFNNYSLTQPRHFCKNCRRYWTRGGALRTVPVGGGCRRNKRSSSSATKSSSTATGAATSSTSLSSAGFAFPPSGGGSMTSFMASLQNIAQQGMGNLGLTSFGGALHGVGGLGLSHPQSEVDNFNNHGLFNHNEILPSSLRFSSGFEFPTSGGNSADRSLYSEIDTSKNSTINSSSMVNDSRLAPVKIENNNSLNLVKQLMGISSSNDQFWGANIGNVTNMWTDLSGLNTRLL